MKCWNYSFKAHLNTFRQTTTYLKVGDTFPKGSTDHGKELIRKCIFFLCLQPEFLKIEFLARDSNPVVLIACPILVLCVCFKGKILYVLINKWIGKVSKVTLMYIVIRFLESVFILVVPFQIDLPPALKIYI